MVKSVISLENRSFVELDFELFDVIFDVIRIKNHEEFVDASAIGIFQFCYLPQNENIPPYPFIYKALKWLQKYTKCNSIS